MSTLILVVGIALGLVALCVLAASWTRRFRSSAAVASVLLLVAAGLVLWLRTGGTTSFGRAYVLVVTTDVSATGLRNVLAYLPERAPVAAVVLDPATEGAKAPPQGSWTRADRILKRTGDVRAEVLAVASRVDAHADHWGTAVTSACLDLIGRRPGFFRKPTIVVVGDDGAVWRNAQLAGLSTEAVLSALAAADQVELYSVSTKGSETSGTLSLVLSHRVIPAVQSIADLSGYSLDIRLTGISEDIDAQDLDLHVQLYGPDDAAGASRVFSLQSAAAGDISFDHVDGFERTLRAEVPLSDISLDPTSESDSARLEPGLYLLRVDAGTKDLRFSRALYLHVEASGVLFLGASRPDLSETVDIGRLAHRSWSDFQARTGIAAPVGLKQLLDSFFSRRYSGQSTRTPAFARAVDVLPMKRLSGSENALALPTAHSDGIDDRTGGGKHAARLAAVVDAQRSLVLIEPNEAQLIYIDALLDLDARIRAGLDVVVIAPPTRTSEAWPAWMPAAAVARADDPAIARCCHRDERLYFSFDCSRAMQFELESGDTSGLAQQVAFANGLLDGIGFESSDHFREENGLVVGHNTARRARLQGEEGAPAARVVTLYPTVVHRALNRDSRLEGIGDFGSGSEHGYQLDVAPGHVSTRLLALSAPPGDLPEGPDLRRIVDGQVYPNTHVVVFVSDLPQLDNEKMPDLVARVIPAVGYPAPRLRDPRSLQDLVAVGVQVHVVTIAQAKRLPGYAEYLAEHGKPLALNALDQAQLAPDGLVERANNLTPIVITSRTDAADKSATLAQALRRREPGVAVVGAHDRIVDQRIPSASPAPEDHLVLTPISARGHPPDPYRPVLLRSVDTEGGSVRVTDMPLVVSSPHGEGNVVVMAYSPFAADVWNRDAGAAAWNGGLEANTDRALARYEGWGIQRWIDMHTLAGSVRPVPSTRVVIQDVILSSDESRIEVRCWGRFGSIDAPTPMLEIPDSSDEGGKPLALPLEMTSVDLIDQWASFVLDSDRQISGTYTLRLGQCH